GGWPRPRFRWRDVALLGLAAAVSGCAFGALLDLQVWVGGCRGAGDLGWQPGMPTLTRLVHFGRFCAVTSLVYDSFRAGGSVLMVLLLAAPVVAALGRVRSRFSFEVVPA